MVQKAKLVVFSVLLVLLFVIVLFVPIFPVKSVVVHTRTRLLLFHVETSDNSAAEVTNKDSVGANFTVELRLSEMKPVLGVSNLMVLYQQQSPGSLMLEPLSDSIVPLNGALWNPSILCSAM